MTSVTENSISFSWRKSTTDNYGDVIQYHWLIFSDGTPSLKLLNSQVICSDSTSFSNFCYNLNNLKQGNVYKFWIVAVNVVGSSEYSDPIDDTVTSDGNYHAFEK